MPGRGGRQDPVGVRVTGPAAGSAPDRPSAVHPDTRTAVTAIEPAGPGAARDPDRPSRLLRAEHDALLPVLHRTPDPGFDRPAACPGWSVRDVLAHCAAALSRVTAGNLHAFTPALNEADVAGRRAWPLAEILSELAAGYLEAGKAITRAGGKLDVLALGEWLHGVRVTSHACDVSDEAQVLRFRDELLEQHASDHVDLVFSNAGVFGGASFVKDSRQEWERTFAINWQGVYFCARTFLPLLIASGDGVLVNTSSVAGCWATAGPGAPPITAYSTSNFAIKGFSEALIEDLRSNAPQVRVVVVMPGVVNTDIAETSRRALGLPEWEQLSDAELLEQIPDIARTIFIGMGLLAEDFTADDLRQLIPRLRNEFQGKGFTAAQAATIILDGVRSGAWRILVGEEAKMLDEQARANPEAPWNYENYAEMYGPLIAQAEAAGTSEP